MKGRNVLELNSATMCLAVEYYLREVVFKDDAQFKVESVKETGNRIAGVVEGFTVTISEGATA